MPNHKTINRTTWIALLISAVSIDGATAQEEFALEFNRDIRPILSSHCYQCHGPDEQERQADLRLDTKPGVRDAFGTTNLQNNAAWQRLISQDPLEVMPPPTVHTQITQRELTQLKKWIGQGAPFQQHWSFIQPTANKAPSVKQVDWVKNPIDQFVLARLEAKQQTPSPLASREQLIRRATLDLTGLPPTIAEIDAFLADQRPDAYAHLVDRLLKSSRLGERLAVPWLDAARYADTNGFSIDDHRDMWLWREWVIDAFNKNMPFDQFLTEQLAGDLLPNATDRQRLATGFLRNSMNTHEGGTLPEEYRVIYIADKVDTVATVFLGLTLRCAQCHDHKYDPITQQDYYRFYSFFDTAHERGKGAENGNTEPTLRMDGPLTPGSQFRKDVQQRIATLEQYLIHPPELLNARAQWEQQATGDAPLQQALATSISKRTPNDWKTINEAFAKTNRLWGRHIATIKREISFLQKDLKTGQASVMVMQEQGPRQTYVLTRGQYDQPDSNQPVQPDVPAILPRLQFEPPAAPEKSINPINPWEKAKWIWDNAEAAAQEQDNQPKYFRRSFQLDSLPTNAVLWVTADNRCTPYINGKRLGSQQPWMTPGHFDIQSHLIEGKNTLAIAATNQGGPAGMLASLVIDNQIQVTSNAQWRVANERRDNWQQIDLQDDLWQLATELGPATMAPWNLSHSAEDPRTKLRSQPSRLDLARWMVDSRNPLTARVAVNRYWQMLFGRGLVASPNDFGSQGNYPTHPQLLDWLAMEFRQTGWDTKKLLKTIVMSATYRQSSAAPQSLYQEDPHNELLARATRYRLPAEFIRDSALFMSGTMDTRIGGPSVYPDQPHGLWREISHFGYTHPFSAQAFYPSDSTGQHRRSMYTFWKRTSPPPSMIAFDAPTREVCSVERSRTNTPIQALVLLNDPQYVTAARNLAKIVLQSGGDTTEQRIEFLFRLTTSRRPDPQEQALLTNRYQKLLKQFKNNKQTPGESIHPNSAKLAAWTIIASTVLNLDEVITRE